MRTIARTIFAFALVVAVGAAVPAAGQTRSAKKIFTYEQVFGGAQPGPPGAGADRPSLMGQLPTISGWADDQHYLETRQDPADKQMKTFKVTAVDGSATVYQAPPGTARPGTGGFGGGRGTGGGVSSPDGTRTVSARDRDLVLTEVATQQTRQLTANPGEERIPRFSPDGNWIAYTRDGNLFAYDIPNGLEHQYTDDGNDVIYNGWASWVYMEEILGRATAYAAFWWSPDSKKLAFLRFDDSPVPVFPIYHADGQHGELERQRYPKAGDPNPYVQLGIASVGDGKVTWADFDPKADHYVAWPY